MDTAEVAYKKSVEWVRSNAPDMRIRYRFGPKSEVYLKIQAIKDLRNRFYGLQLVDAKNIIEDYFGQDGNKPAPPTEGNYVSTTAVEDRVLMQNFLMRMRQNMTQREFEAFERTFP